MDNVSRAKSALLDRLDVALRDLYHNATPHLPSVDDHQCSELYSQFELWSEWEFRYVQTDLLGCTKDYWAREAKRGFTHNERYYWLVTRIVEFGKLHTWGRGGRTVAPLQLVDSRGGGYFRIKGADYFTDMSNAALTDMIQVLEAFNKYVKDWNSLENLTALWQDYLDNKDDAEAA